MRLTRNRLDWLLASVFTIAGIAFLSASIIKFCAEQHPHGLASAKQLAAVGPLLIFAGFCWLLDKQN